MIPPSPEGPRAPVAIVATENYPVPPVLGGAVAAYVSELAPRLGGRDVTVVSVRHPGLADTEQVGRVRHRRVAPPAPLRLLVRLVPTRRSWRGDAEKRAYVEQVARVLRGFEGTIVVGNRPRSVPRLRRAAPGARLVLRLDNLHLKDPEALAACDALLPCSAFVGDAVARVLDGRVPVHVAHNGVDLDAFRPHDPAERIEARRSLGLPPASPTVLFVGRLVPDKGAHLLLEAVPGLLRARPDLSVVIVGSARFGRGELTAYERELRAQAEAIGPAVHLAGFVPPAALPVWFAAADVFCAPGLWDEPFGMVYAESMAAGVPPVGTARGGIPEVVVDGESGLLLPRSPSAADVEERLLALLEDDALRERLARAGRTRAEERFSWEAMARSVEAVLR